MRESEARNETIEIFGEESFTERDDAGGMTRFFVGALPKVPGPYVAFMGFSWEEALEFARKHHKPRSDKGRHHHVAGVLQEDVDDAEN